MGCPDFALPGLQSLRADPRFEVVAVYSMPDKPKGRGHQLGCTAVKQAALDVGLPVFTPTSFRKDPAAVEQLRALAPDFLVVIAYGMILPQEVLDIPRLGPINLHASLLPRYRGPAPLQFALMSGDEVTGNSVMLMNARMDEGDVLAMQELPILAGETLSSLHDRLSQAGGPFLVKTIADFAEGRIKPKPQDHSRATYTQKITPELARLRWHEKSVRELDRQVRAMYPAPGAWFEIDGERWKVGAAERTTICGEPGVIMHADLDNGFLVGCRDGSCLKLLRLQRPGKGYVDTPDFLRGLHQKLAGKTLS